MHFNDKFIQDRRLTSQAVSILRQCQQGLQTLVVVAPLVNDNARFHFEHLLSTYSVPAEFIDIPQLADIPSKVNGVKQWLKEVKSPIVMHIEPLIRRGKLPVITNYLATHNQSCILASSVSNCLDADELWIWTETDGLYTSSENRELLALVTYDEALKMVRGSHNYIDQQSLLLAQEKKLILRFKNAFHPESEGTIIGPITL